MNSDFFWNIFLETGAPEAYLLYHKALRGEAFHVPDHQSPGSSGNGLQ